MCCNMGGYVREGEDGGADPAELCVCDEELCEA